MNHYNGNHSCNTITTKVNAFQSFLHPPTTAYFYGEKCSNAPNISNLTLASPFMGSTTIFASRLAFNPLILPFHPSSRLSITKQQLSPRSSLMELGPQLSDALSHICNYRLFVAETISSFVSSAYHQWRHHLVLNTRWSFLSLYTLPSHLSVLPSYHHCIHHLDRHCPSQRKFVTWLALYDHLLTFDVLNAT